VNNLAILPPSNCASENADEVNASRTLLHRPVRQPNECRPTARMGDEGKAAKRGGALAALLFEHPFVGAVNTVNFDLDQSARCDPALRLCAASFSQTGAVVFLQNGTNLGHQFGGLFLSSSGLIRCNSIRDTVQAQHKHIPRQRNGHHPRDSEP
jgi:hypothetical protein